MAGFSFNEIYNKRAKDQSISIDLITVYNNLFETALLVSFILYKLLFKIYL